MTLYRLQSPDCLSLQGPEEIHQDLVLLPGPVHKGGLRQHHEGFQTVREGEEQEDHILVFHWLILRFTSCCWWVKPSYNQVYCTLWGRYQSISTLVKCWCYINHSLLSWDFSFFHQLYLLGVIINMRVISLICIWMWYNTYLIK